MSAINRRAKNAPINLIDAAIEHVNDKTLPIPYKFRMELFDSLLRAKHFGKGGGQKEEVAESKKEETKGE